MSTTLEQDYSPALEVAELHRERVIEADDLLREICRANRRPTFAELTFFNRECGWNEQRVQQENRRMGNVLRFQSESGSSADREAAAQEAATAAVILEKEGPKLAAKIEELQAKLNGLERDQRLSAKRCEEQSQAVQRLRELVPEHIAGAVRSEVSRIESTIGREILDSEIRINELQCCLDPSRYRDEAIYLESLKRSFPDAITEIVEGRILRRKLSPAWPAIREGIQAELAELMPRVETLKVQRAEMLEQAESPLGFYAG
jgi:hypothetical protein